MQGLTHDEIIQRGFDENNLPSGYYRSDANTGGGGNSGGTSPSSGGATYFDRVANIGAVNGHETRDYNEYLRWGGPSIDQPSNSSGGGVSSPSAPQIPQSPFTNEWWSNARKEAFDTLTPYYVQKLKDAGGDVELAKKFIEEDYQRGVRYRKEDLALEQGSTERASKKLADQFNLATEGFQKGEAYRAAEQSSQLAGDRLTAEQETRESVAKANQRGTYVAQIPQGTPTAKAPVSNYYDQYIGRPLSQQQSLRKQAIERAIKRQSEVAGLELKGEELKKTYGTQEAQAGLAKRTLASTFQEEQDKAEREKGLTQQNIAFRDEQDRLKREQESRAYGEVVPQRYQSEYSSWRAVNNLG